MIKAIKVNSFYFASPEYFSFQYGSSRYLKKLN